MTLSCKRAWFSDFRWRFGDTETADLPSQRALSYEVLTCFRETSRSVADGR